MAFHTNDEIVRKTLDANQRVSDQDLLDSGGEWIGAVRNWIQWNATNGDRCEWNNNTPLHFRRNITPEFLFEFGAQVARMTLEQFKHHLVTDDEKHMLKTFQDERNWRTANADDLESDRKRTFDPDPGRLHFLQWQSENQHGHEIAQFDSKKEAIRLKELTCSYPCDELVEEPGQKDFTR